MSTKYRNAAKCAVQGKRCMRLNDVVSYLSVSKSYVNRLIKLGKFPVRTNIGANLSNSGKLVVWEKVAVDQWIDKQMGGK